MLTVDEIKRIGIHAPKEYQRLIATLIIALGNLYRSGKIQLEPLPETMLNEGQTSPVTDIMLFDNERDETPIIIEIAHGTGVKSDQIKVKELVASNFYGIREAFIYDYKNKRWHIGTSISRGKALQPNAFRSATFCSLILICFFCNNRIFSPLTKGNGQLPSPREVRGEVTFPPLSLQRRGAGG
ncbi:MAG: hypothetical protein RMI34_02160 [Chloroherpetonaceae bacterium]|nr:hypothetical protein [Chloroherpetonaceae bacterium]MCS7210448.1 hypothetical protein [Chloroherpetonaceae bacterium]MDW8018861.1 hypothetical protein [Chloroherpetonaceae bacterium]MDW8466695.1 hypothetical protein [Chloroherpetonaceae bacterium]